ncbi:hypothetical protein HJC23_012459 [Cyclotella cryptica]|uniref:Methyltransferase domain-containing protein n=1 Tax=Cyclotella cryptica TaxID=29204 RepID=A0ABD3P6P1_9STRA|eukprot:CCRYP_017472-RA/>CCRYP_017472-RA protein AED:0.07 eAED:0.07 QI:0/-1/0/1/-1/1/1/0/495
MGGRMASKRLVHHLLNIPGRVLPTRLSRHRRIPFPADIKRFSADSSSSQLRRRRRRNPGPSDSDGGLSTNNAPSIASSESASPASPFTPVNEHGAPLSSDEYLSLASLSPWVPCPDVVIKRLFEIASASAADRHVDLGCGDGRLNFAAVGFPHHVSYSLGIDVDQNVLERGRIRLQKRFVPTWNHNDVDNLTETAGLVGDRIKSEMERLEFVQGDLIQLVKRQKELYHQRLRDKTSSGTNHQHDGPRLLQPKPFNLADTHNRDWSKEDQITGKISSSTVITMYFVHEALRQLKPYLASLLGGKENVRVITVGYEMEGWDPDWAERVLDLTVFRYDMSKISADPEEWRLEDDKVNGTGGLEKNMNSKDHRALDLYDQEEEMSSNLRQQKHQQDMDLLHSNLRIHHDQELDDFASFRAKRKAMEHSSSSLNHTAAEEWEMMEGGWDFDEEEDLQMMMRAEEKNRMEEKMAGRRRLMAGLDTEKDDKKSARPVWKKPE